MEFLDKLVIPQPGYNLELLNTLLILALGIFLNYSGLLFGSILLSIFFRPKNDTKSESTRSIMARQFATLMTRKREYVIGLGVVPLLSIIMIYTQLLHTIPVGVVAWQIIAFVVYLVAVLLIYSYKRSFQLTRIFSHARKRIQAEPDKELNEEFLQMSTANSRIYHNYGTLGLVLMFIAMWMLIGSMTVAVDQADWPNETFLTMLFSIDSMVKTLHFVTAAIAVSSIALLFINNYWEKDALPAGSDYLDSSNQILLKTALLFTLLQPVFFLFNLLLTPAAALSNMIFITFLIALLIIFLLVHFLYLMIKEKRMKYAPATFILFMLVILALGIKERSSLHVTNMEHRLVIDKKYEEHKEELLASMGRATEEVDGEEIYQRCTACHKQEDTPAAPAHASIMDKYLNDKEALVKYILNPVKVDPNYPAMPSQGLKPNEAEAVAKFMIEKYGGGTEKAESSNNSTNDENAS